MPRYRQELEQVEHQILAPYAQFSGNTRGRRFKEAPPVWRTEYQRDRDRVIHSRAFRRLEYKTQVFLNGSGDHLRTRLTHTIEVSAISRNIASALRLNTDLAETIALAHDLGHSPFGHKGETVLNELMQGHGGFEHNHHSLRIVEELEQKYPKFSGLNLSWEVLEGLAKHQTAFDRPGGKTGFIAKNPSLEAQIANLADEITYYSHDLDDGLDSDLLCEKELSQHVRIWADAAKAVKAEHGDLPDECRRYFIIRTIIDMQLADVIATSERLIEKAKVQSADDVRRHAKPLIQYGPERRKLNLELRRYLYKNLYFNTAVNEPHIRAKQLLKDLFDYYLKHPKEIGETAHKQIRKAGKHRAVCDYIAGMTDRYAMLEGERLFGKSASLMETTKPSPTADQAPWRKLKETEMGALLQRQNGSPLPETLSRLRKLVEKCGESTDADASICYHGSLALIFEFNRDWPNALKHRRLEIRKIRLLHKLEQQNPTGGYAIQNYQDQDLKERLEILEQIKSKTISGQSFPPNRQPMR